MRKPKVKASTWPPAHLLLPDTLEGIEAGRPDTNQPLDQSPDARRARLLTSSSRRVRFWKHCDESKE